MTAASTFEAGYSNFCKLAAAHRVVPVWRQLVADTLTPVGAFQAVVGDGDGFLLESVERGEHWGRYSFLGRAPLGTVIARGRSVSITGVLAAESLTTDAGVLTTLEELLARFAVPEIEGLPPLQAGIVGYLGYDVVREVESLGPPPKDDLGHPDAVLAVIGELVAFDHLRQRVTLIASVVVSEAEQAWLGASEDDPLGQAAEGRALAERYEAAQAALDALEGSLSKLGPTELLRIEQHPASAVRSGGRLNWIGSDYTAAVRRAKEEIARGEIFQVVLSKRVDHELAAPPFAVYRMLRLVNPSPFMYFLRQGGVTVAGASPESLVQVHKRRVVARPIAGTRPRGADEEADARLEAELCADQKERAEHVMLVDLARNDLGRVARYGTMAVDELATVERFSHVMHLTSEVSGELRAGLGPIDVLRATIPAGTLSGAPKVRAMGSIDALEPTKRGVYGGVVGYLAFSGDLDAAIAIRTLVVGEDGRASVQAGAGIVADSDPETEDAECGHKQAAVEVAVALAEQHFGPASGSAPGPASPGQRP